MCGHDHLICHQCKKYTDFNNARAYGSLPCTCFSDKERMHKELLEAIKSTRQKGTKKEFIYDLQCLIWGCNELGSNYDLEKEPRLKKAFIELRDGFIDKWSPENDT